MRLAACLLVLIVNGIVRAEPAFEVYWNIPSEKCVNVRPDKYNITTNEGRKFRGDKIVIFYEPDLGLYPWCEPEPGHTEAENDCQVMINGGVPQAVNITAHLEKLQLDIVRGIPDPNYDSIAIIDWERWRPLFDLNWSRREVYKRLSIKLVLEKYKNLGEKSAEYLARFLFDYHAKQMFLETMRVAKELRPKARWAFWDYPMCNYDVGYSGELECRPQYEIINDQMLWLFNAQDLILPQLYFYEQPYPTLLRQNHLYAKIRQAEQINEKLGKRLPIYGYSKAEYAADIHPNKTLKPLFYTKSDTCSSIKYTQEMGIDGMILWGSSRYLKARCPHMEAYVNNVLGTFTSSIVHRADKCARKQCNGRGRCQSVDRMPSKKCELAYQPEFKCICNFPYEGKECEIGPGERKPTLSTILSSTAATTTSVISTTEPVLPSDTHSISGEEEERGLEIARNETTTESPILTPVLTTNSVITPTIVSASTTLASTTTIGSTPMLEDTTPQLVEESTYSTYSIE